MGNTQYYSIPYPDRDTIQNEGWDETLKQGFEAVDSAIHTKQVDIDATIGIMGESNAVIQPYTMVGSGKMWPQATTVLGPITLDSMIDGWFSALKNLMDGKLSLPLVFPEAAYCKPVASNPGETVTASMGPVVKLNNDSDRTSIVNAPVYLSNKGGCVPAEPLSSQYPIFYPKTGIAKTLNNTQFSIYTEVGDYVVNNVQTDFSTEDKFTVKSLQTNTFGTYYPAYFDYDNFTEGATLTLTGIANGTFRIYGLNSAGTVIYEDVSLASDSMYSEDTATTTSLWYKVLGISYKGTDLTETSTTLEMCQVYVTVTSGASSNAFVRLGAVRHYDYTSGSASDLTVTNPEQYFRVAWESYDPGWLWNSANNVAGIPFEVFSIGLLDNKIAYLKQDILNNSSMTPAEVDSYIRDLMTSEILDVPTTPQSMYVLGSSKEGVATTWKIVPKIEFTTVSNYGYDGKQYYNKTNPGSEQAYPTDSTWPDDGFVPKPEQAADLDPCVGTLVLYKYVFPTDIGSISQVLWANSDALNQYGKLVGLAVTVPIGRCISSTASGNPAQVRLWTPQLVDNISKFSAIMDMATGYFSGATSGETLVTQLESLASYMGFSATETGQFVNALPVLPALMRFLPIDNLYNKRDFTLKFTVNSCIDDNFTGKNYRAEIQQFQNNTGLSIESFRVYFSIPDGESATYITDEDSSTEGDYWGHYYDDTFRRCYVPMPFADGKPQYKELHFLGAGRAFVGVTTFSDGSKYVCFPDNAEPLAEIDPAYYNNITVPKYLPAVKPVLDGYPHIVIFGKMESSYFSFGDSIAVYCEFAGNDNPIQSLGVTIENETSGNTVTCGNVTLLKSCIIPLNITTLTNILEADTFDPKSYEDISNKSTTLSENTINCKIVLLYNTSALTTIEIIVPTITENVVPNSWKMYESDKNRVGGAIALANFWTTLLGFYCLWMISPSAASITTLTAVLGLDEKIKNNVRAYTGLTDSRKSSIYEWLRRWTTGRVD